MTRAELLAELQAERYAEPMPADATTRNDRGPTACWLDHVADEKAAVARRVVWIGNRKREVA